MDISVGAVGAALIAAIVALLGLILGKEQKTSEFRQAWIDALRTQLVSYAANINSIVDKLSTDFVDNKEKISSLLPHYENLNKASFDIKMRVNSDEEHASNLLGAMKAFEDLARDEPNFTVDNIKPIEDKFLNASKKLLKHEWKRVKRGEAPFIFAKWLVIAAIIVAVLAMFFLDREPEKKLEAASAGSVTQNIECHTGLITATNENKDVSREAPSQSRLRVHSKRKEPEKSVSELKALEGDKPPLCRS